MILMNTRTVKVFIASSDELSSEREKFDTLFAHLNRIFSARGIHLEASRWEFLDSSFGFIHKQEEYNREIKTCDICVVMFWQKFGEYTNIELNIANTELRAGRKPSKVYVFFKEPGVYSKQIVEFKANFERDYGHFYSKFDSCDKLQLDFVLQLERFLNSHLIKVEDSLVKIDGVFVANLDNIGFAAGNEKYVSLRDRLMKLEQEISSLKIIHQTTADESIENIINEKKLLRIDLKKELTQHEEFLLGAAIKVAQYSGERISNRMKRAIAMFEEGKVGEANALLDDAERDAEDIVYGIEELKDTGKQSVDELILRTSIMLADDTFTIDERIKKVDKTFQKAISLAKLCDYDSVRYYNLLLKYSEFLHTFAKYDRAEEICWQTIHFSEDLYGKQHIYTADAYNELGIVLHKKDQLIEASKYYEKALKIREKELGWKHPDTAASYNNLGVVYDTDEMDPSLLGPPVESLFLYTSALKIYKATLGDEHPNTANIYNNLGSYYFYRRKEYDRAIDFYVRALEIYIMAFGEEHLTTAGVYSNLGNVCLKNDKYEDAIDFFNKAFEIRKNILGEKHPSTLYVYNHLGIIYDKIKEPTKAMEYFLKAGSSDSSSLKSSEFLVGKTDSTNTSTERRKYSIYKILGRLGLVLGVILGLLIRKFYPECRLDRWLWSALGNLWDTFVNFIVNIF